jgi:hypothetical protein
MTEIRKIAARSIAQYVKVIREIRPQTNAGLWFRGQASATYRLTPGALRNTTAITDGLGRPIAPGQVVRARGGEVTGLNPERMLAEFKRQARPFVEGVPANDFEWMFIAQHHRLLTRLLDWSTNALVALYFAASTAERQIGNGTAACEEFCAGEEFSDQGFAVFVIDPGAMNNAAFDIADPIDIAANAEEWKAYLSPTKHGLDAYAPVCITAPHIAPRIRAQSGVFTLHGSNIDPVDFYDVFRPFITKIFIPFTSTSEIVSGLAQLGINESFIYPSLDSIALDITTSERLRHGAEKAEFFDRHAANQPQSQPTDSASPKAAPSARVTKKRGGRKST